MIEYFTQLGMVGIVMIFLIKEIFAWLKIKKANQDNTDYKKDIAGINLQLTNHITEIKSKTDNIEKKVGETKTDIKLIQRDIRNILARLTNKN